ncbi:MAG: type II toxin-antitoxin system VapC family toxin [Halobaculum sp.]
MPSAVVDTTVLIGAADDDDRHHEVATEIVERIDAGTLPTGHVTNYVLLETLNWIHERKRHATAVGVSDRLYQSAGFVVRHTPQSDLSQTNEVFEQFDALAFGDATVVAYMHREGIDYPFDDDFDALDGVTRLDTPENPYA